MAKKFKWHSGMSSTTLTDKQIEKITALRYSDVDLVGFLDVFAGHAGLRKKLDKLTHDEYDEALRKTYEEITELINTGEYDKILEESLVVGS